MELRNVASISAAFFFIFLSFTTAQQYLVILFNTLGKESLALASLVIVYSVFLLASTVAPTLISLCGGLKRAIILGALTYALFSLVVTLESDLLLLIASLIVGVGAALLWVSSGQILTDSSREKTVARNFSIQTIFSSIGAIAGIFLGGFLVESVSLTMFYLLLFSLGVCGALFLLFLQPAREEMTTRPFRPAFLVDPRMLCLLPFLFAIHYLLGQSFTALSILTINILGLALVPFIVTIFRISNVVGALGSGLLADSFDKARLLFSVGLAALVGACLLYGEGTSFSLYASTALIGIASAIVYPVVLAWFKERMLKQENIYAIGIFHVYANTGVIAALAGNIWLSPQQSFLPGIVALLAGIVGIFLFEKLTRKIRR